MASYKNCLAVLFGLSLLIESSKSEVQIDSSCSFNDHELEPDSRSPHEMNPAYIWPNGEIPYVFTDNWDYNDKQLILNNMKQIEQRSCFRFKRYYSAPSDRKYLEIHIPAGAPSCLQGNSFRFQANVNNGYLVSGEKNALQLYSKYKLTDNADCQKSAYKDIFEGGILHEMFHGLGVGHTMRRPDRDNYVTVYYGNIQNPSQYEPCSNCKVYPDIPYECNSIMHYGYTTFAKRPRDSRYPTMVAKNKETCKIGANGGKTSTANDWKLVKKIGNTVCGHGGGGSTGQWGAWGNYGYCSGTCESAKQQQRRSCVGGTGCQGSSRRSVSCELSGCEEKCEKGNNCSRDKCGYWCCKYGWGC